jgi:thioesterase domain-containing protein
MDCEIQGYAGRRQPTPGVSPTWTVTQVIQHPTLEALTMQLVDFAGQDTDVTEFKRADSGRPLFLTHLRDADVTGLARLANQMDLQSSIYGLSLRDPADIGGSLECLADRHIRSMRRIQPQGPYRIAGWSFGGLVAYEIARQLVGLNETVEFLGLIDVYTPSLSAQLMSANMANVRPVASYPGPMEKALMEAEARYVPQAMPVAVSLFCAKEVAGDRSRGWSSIVGDNLRIREVPGNQTAMMSTQATDLARAITAEIQGCAASSKKIAPEYEPGVVLQLGTLGTQAPMFCAPGAGASVTTLLSLAGALPGTHVVGLQPRGLNEGQVPHLAVEAAASSAVRSILAAAPRGPYCLVGHSFGGWVVFEIARQLSAIQKRVAPVILLDVDPPSSPDKRPWRYSLSASIAKLARLLGRTADIDLLVNQRSLEQLDFAGQLNALMNAMKSAKLIPKSARLAYVRSLVQVFWANLNTLYLPESAFTGRVLLFQTQDVDPEDDEPISPEEAATRWRNYAPNLEVIQASGNHMTMLREPHIDVVARAVQLAWAQHR